ncbi:hypothetical protein CspHIS471_0204860 [Cutaneotrichosporon sp. HIS471]|nr:hypothetical protein CspHIS471_0204860 [Cutaneotrichosporon sp. HIS471]
MQSHGRASPPFDTPVQPTQPRPTRNVGTPADKLRALLDLMNGEMRAARPTPSYRRDDKDATPRAREPRPNTKEESDDSLSSPPPRIHYTRPRREPVPPTPQAPSPPPPPVPEEEASPPRRFAALPKRASPPRRLTSRAVALRAAAAAAAEHEAQQSILPRETHEKSPPTPLENFIASTATPTPYEPRQRATLSEEPRRRMSVPETAPHACPRPSTPPESPPHPPRSPSPSPPPRVIPLYQPSPPQRRQAPPSPKGQQRAYEAEPEEPEPPRRRDRRIATPPNSSASFAAGLDESREPVHDLEETEWRWRDESIESSDSSVPIDLNRGPAARLIVAEEMSMSRSRKSLSAESSPPASRTFATAEPSASPSATFATAERSSSAPRSFAATRSQTASMTFATAPRLPTSSPSFATASGPSREHGSVEKPPKQQRSFERSPKERSFEHERRNSADTSLPAVPGPESSDEEENSALVARRKMFRSSKSPEPRPEEPVGSRTRRLSTSKRSESSADARYAALKASMGVETDSDDSSMGHEPSRQDSSLLGSLWKGLPSGLRDDSSLDMRHRPTLAELSTRLDSTLMTSAMPRDSTRRFERSDEHESMRRFEVSDDNGSTRRYERAEERDISVARSDFDDLGGLPQSSPPRLSPSQSLRQSRGKPLLSLRQPQLDWQDDETTERRPEPEGPEGSEAATDDLEWGPQGLDTTSDSWLELNAAAALNPPTQETSGPTPPLESPARADSDTLPDTPPRQRPGIHRSLLRAATTPAPAHEPVAPTPLRSALKGGRFESRFPPTSPSVRWSPDVLDNEPAVEEEGVVDTVTEPEQQEIPSTSPPSSPPQHLSTPEAFSTPVRAPAVNNRTPRPPGAWGTPLPPPGLPPSTPLPAPPISGLPAPSQQGLLATPPRAGPATPGLPTPRPPGAWFSPARYIPPRMSRLRNEVRLDDSASSTGSEVSVHRLAFSPKRRRTGAASPNPARVLLPTAQVPPAAAEQVITPEAKAEGVKTKPEPSEPATPRPHTRSPATSPPGPVEPRTPHPPGAMPKDEPEDGDTSWTARIKRAFTPGPTSPSTPVTPRTASRTRLAEAQDALDTASRASAKARSRVSAAQDAWRAAIATKSAPEPEPEPEPLPIPQRRRGIWLLWVTIELLMLWAVFRVTLEYATSYSFLARSDPFGPFAPSYAVGVRLPAALEAFGKHPPRGVSLFDLLDALGLGLGGTIRQWAPPT